MNAATRFVAGGGIAMVVALVLLGGAAGIGAGLPVARDNLTRAQVDELVRAHNAWRKRVGVLSLRWTADLAATAQTRATYLATHGCFIEHGLLPEDVGENLYRASPLKAGGRPDALNPVTPTQVVDAWGDESASYSHATDTCAPGRQCGHYTQIVWPSTEDVGCGMAICPSQGQVWVCRYRPRGNVKIIIR